MSKPQNPCPGETGPERARGRFSRCDGAAGQRPARSLPGRALGLLALMLAAGPSLRHAGAAAAPSAVVRNGGMEAPYVDGLAQSWRNNSWGDAVASFSADSAQPHSGLAAQHIHCESVTDGAAQIQQLGIAVRAGQVYTLTVWLRGTIDSPVFVGVRQNGAPYKRYLTQFVRVTPKWRRYVITGAPSEDGPDAGIYIAFSAPGDLWVDDVELRDGPPADEAHTAALPVRKGNLLYNSGFELGADGWGPVGRLPIETQGALQGHACARCTAGGQPILLESRPVVIRPGQRYTISASLHADGPAEVEMVAMEYADEGSDSPGRRDAIRQTFRIDQKWQRVSLSGILRAPLVDGYLLQINRISGARTVWVDAVQWEEGRLTPYRPAAPVEVAVRAPVQLFSPGQQAVTECQVYQAPGAHAPAAVTYRLENGDGLRVAERTIRCAPQPSRPAGGRASRPDLPVIRLSWKLARPGMYRVVAALPGTPIGRTGQAILCCFPGPPPRSTAPRIGIHAWSDPDSPNKAIRAAAYLGAGDFRLHDFHSFVQWYVAEPSPGQFVWFDRDVDDLAQRGYRLLGTLCRTPLWAAQAGAQHHRYADWCSAPPGDWEAWARYVGAMAGHYHNQIHEWEVWNEPWNAAFWTGTPAEYVQLLAHTRSAVKAADPTALVVGGCFAPEYPSFTNAVLHGGGLASMDVVSYHHYMTPALMADQAGGRAPAFYEAAVNLSAEIRSCGGQQPLWCTETGVPCPSFYSWLPAQGPQFSGRAAVATLVKGLTLLLAAGVERVYYYHVGDLFGGAGYPSKMLNSSYTLLDYDGSPKPTLPALAQVIAMLGDVSDPVDLSTPELRAYSFRRKNGYVAVAWARGGAASSPPPLAPARAGAVTVRDAMGAAISSSVTIGDQPVYLLAASRDALIQALHGTPREEWR